MEMNLSQVVCLAALIVLFGVFVASGIRAGIWRRNLPTAPPLPTADATYIPSDGDEGDLRGYYPRQQRAQREAEAAIQRAGLSGRMTAARLRSSTRRRNERRDNDTQQ